MGCRAKLGIRIGEVFYYDLDSVKVRKCLVPFIIWVAEHQSQIRSAVSEFPMAVHILVDGRRLYASQVELSDEESCFTIDLDRGTWRDRGYCPAYLDWGEVWEFCKYKPFNYTILWDKVPNWDQYHASRGQEVPAVSRVPWWRTAWDIVPGYV